MTAPIVPGPQPQLIVKAGGLTTGEHLAHIVGLVFTAGLWLPFYIYFAVRAPKARYEVMVPYGADPAAVQALYAQVAAANGQTPQTPEQIAEARTQSRQIAIVIAIGVVVIFAVLVAGLWLQNNNPF